MLGADAVAPVEPRPREVVLANGALVVVIVVLCLRRWWRRFRSVGGKLKGLAWLRIAVVVKHKVKEAEV